MKAFDRRSTALGVAAVAVLAALVLAACGGGSSSDGTTASGTGATSEGAADAGSKSSEPIVIGVAMANSGLMKAFDEPPFESLKLKVDEINEEGGIDGRQLKIVTGNTRSNIAQTGQVAENLLSEGAEIMVVSADFDFGSPAALVAQQAGVASFSMGASSPKFGVQGIGDLAYTPQPSVANEAAALATFSNEEGWKDAYLLLDETSAYTEGLCGAYEKFFPELGGKIAGSDSFKNEDSNFSVLIEHLKAADPEVIELCSYPPGGASLVRQLRAAGVEAPIVTGNAFDGTFWTKAVPGLKDFYVSVVASVFGDDPEARVNQWVKAYEKAYGEPPERGQSSLGFAIGEALQIALEEDGGSTEGSKLAEALDGFEEVELTGGPTTFTAETHIPLDRQMRILEYVNGKPSFKTLVKPEVEVTLADGV